MAAFPPSLEPLFSADPLPPGNLQEQKRERNIGITHTASLNLLLARGSEINAPQEGGRDLTRWVFDYARDSDTGDRQNVAYQIGKLCGWAPSQNPEGGPSPEYTFLLAAMEGDAETLNAYLPAFAGRINTIRNSVGSTALHLAALGGRVEVVELLLRYPSVDVNIRTNAGQTPLHLAALYGREAIVRMLLKRGADSRRQDMDENTVLHTAAKKGFTNVAEILVQQDPRSLETRNRFGKTPFDLAVENGQVKKQIRLIEEEADFARRNSPGDLLTPLELAAQKGLTFLVRLFLRRGDEMGRALHFATINGRTATVEMLLKQGADFERKMPINKGEFYYSPIELAAINGRANLVQLFLLGGANACLAMEYRHRDVGQIFIEDENINFLPGDPLYFASLAIKEGHANVIRALLDQRPEWIHYMRPILHLAARMNQPECVRALIDKGVNIEAKDDYGDTPLQTAVICGSLNSVRALVEAGANLNNLNNVDRDDNDLGSPLMRAVQEGYKTIACFLLESGADINLQDKDGNTALHWAVARPSDSCVELLFSKGANPNLGDMDGATPLHCAVEEENLPMTELLLSKGANPNLGDMDGATPLHCAVKRGNLPLIGLLLSRGANPNLANSNAKTPVHLAAEFQNDERSAEMLRLLLGRNLRDPVESIRFLFAE